MAIPADVRLHQRQTMFNNQKDTSLFHELLLLTKHNRHSLWSLGHQPKAGVHTPALRVGVRSQTRLKHSK